MDAKVHRTNNSLIDNSALEKTINERLQIMERLLKDAIVGTEEQACLAYLGHLLHLQGPNKQGQYLGYQELNQEIAQFLQNTNQRYHNQQELQQRVNEVLEYLDATPLFTSQPGVDGQTRYGFVHQTVQEYCTALHLATRCHQGNGFALLSHLLTTQLHNPHWRNVILLLLNMLPSTTITPVLKSLLNGQLHTHRSAYTNIIQHDLFFLGFALIEGMKVKSELAQQIIHMLAQVVGTSIIIAQRRTALRQLYALCNIKRYAKHAYLALHTLAFKNHFHDTLAHVQVLLTLAQCTPQASAKRAQIIEELLVILHQTTLPFADLLRELAISAINQKYQKKNAVARPIAIWLFSLLANRQDLPIATCLEYIRQLHMHCLINSTEQQLLNRSLLNLLSRKDISTGETLQTALALFYLSDDSSPEEEIASQCLRGIATFDDLDKKDRIHVAQALYESTLAGSPEWDYATQMLLDVMYDPTTPPAIILDATRTLYQENKVWSHEREEATQMLITLLERPDLPSMLVKQIAHLLADICPPSAAIRIEMTYQLLDLADDYQQESQHFLDIIDALAIVSPSDSPEQLLVLQFIRQYITRPTFTIEQRIRLAQALYEVSDIDSEEEKEARQVLHHICQQPNLTPEQAIQAHIALHDIAHLETEEAKTAINYLLTLIQQVTVTIKLRLQCVTRLLSSYKASYKEKAQAFLTLSELLPEEQVLTHCIFHWSDPLTKQRSEESIEALITLLQHPMLPTELRDRLYTNLLQLIPSFHED